MWEKISKKAGDYCNIFLFGNSVVTIWEIRIYEYSVVANLKIIIVTFSYKMNKIKIKTKLIAIVDLKNRIL